MSDPVRNPIRGRISSPEELHDYMRVTSPRLWIMLTVIIILLAGMIVYASTMKMENILEVQAEVFNVDNPEPGEPPVIILCRLEAENGRKELVRIGMPVRLAGEKGKISSLFEDHEQVVASVEMNRKGLGLREGSYLAEIVLEQTSPVDFLIH